MPLQATSGAASYDAFGGGVPFEPTYIEQIFATHLYTGNGSTQTINNGIDLAGKGGFVWLKTRNAVGTHRLYDTQRGVNSQLRLPSTDAADNISGSGVFDSFNANGFTLGANGANQPGETYASWTFREQPKFFDVVTYTGDGVAGRQIAHNLGSAPGAIIVKCTSVARDWAVWQNTLSDGTYLKLNTTDSVITNTSFQVFGDSSGQTSTYFTVGKSGAGVNGLTNANGGTYVAYLFAHNAGGFGLSGTDNVISCGSYTTNGSGVITSPVNLGYEPQWILSKRVDSTGNWRMLDVMRGDGSADGNISNQNYLYSNLSDAESGPTYGEPAPTATGFTVTASTASSTYIYIAIRRGPMRTPTTGTSVFDPEAYTGTSATRTITSGFPVDLSISKIRSQGFPGGWFDRLRGALQVIRSSSTDPEATSADSLTSFASMTGVVLGSDGSGRINTSPDTYAMWNFRRAPGFFDEVCYTGTGSARTVAHNLAAVPEMMIVKRRSGAADWAVYASAIGNTKFLLLNSTGDTITDNVWNNTTPTATEFSVRDQNTVNASGSTYVAYLFATVAGVSKVGSYTGTGATQVINCGFTGGARFVLIKRSSGTGDWYVWDSARGIVAGNDPYLLLNSTAAEVTNTDYVDTASTGFEISSTAPAAINASGGTFIFLAIA